MSSSQSISSVFLYDLEEILNGLMTKTPNKGFFRKAKLIESSAFYSMGLIKISLQSYIQRLLQYVELNNSHFILALKYFNRVIQKGNYKKSNISFHKLFFVCLVAADKYLEDDIFNNSYYAQVGGMKCADLFAMEMEFYEAIEFDLYVNDQEFEDFKKEIYSGISCLDSRLKSTIVKEPLVKQIATRCA